jgi:hypothetical protein
MGHPGFRTSSPSRENGFARPAQLFRGRRRTKRIHAIAISRVGHEVQSRAFPQRALKGVTVLLLHLRDVLVAAEHPVQEEPWLNRPSGGSFTAGT